MASRSDLTILVTGGAGYIGAHTAHLLRARGYKVVVLDRLSNGACPAALVEPLIKADLRDQAALDAVFQTHTIAAVVHFAASIEVGESVRQPLAYFDNNVGSSLSLLRAMQHHHVNGLVFSSTAAVYGNQTLATIPETAAIAPCNPYGASKAMVESILAEQSRAHGLKAIALRYFNASGAAPDLGLGERHQPETHLIPLVIQAALGQRDHIAMYGSDYPTPDGTCLRDYIHVLDLADAHVRALEAILTEQHQGFSAYNLGTGQGYSVRQIIETVRQVSSREFAVIEAERRPGDPARLIADPSAAKVALGWQAQHSDLQQIVADAFRFFSHPPQS